MALWHNEGRRLIIEVVNNKLIDLPLETTERETGSQRLNNSFYYLFLSKNLISFIPEYSADFNIAHILPYH